MDVIVAIGRNIGNEPMPKDEWAEFIALVERIVRRLSNDYNALMIGEAWSPQWGIEGSAWFALSIDDDKVAELQARVLTVASVFGQDAVAFTGGTTVVLPCE